MLSAERVHLRVGNITAVFFAPAAVAAGTRPAPRPLLAVKQGDVCDPRAGESSNLRDPERSRPLPRASRRSGSRGFHPASGVTS